MELRNCPECGKVFSYIRTNLCPECQKKDDESFKVIREYISKNPGVSAIDVSRDTGISEQKVLRFLRQGRLSVGEIEKQFKLECELCGKFVTGGRYCPACQEKLTSGLKKIVREEKRKAIENSSAEKGVGQQKGTQMHTANLWQKKK